MSTSLFTLFILFSGVSYSYPDLTLSQCVDRMIREQDAVSVLSSRYPDLRMTVRCSLQHE